MSVDRPTDNRTDADTDATTARRTVDEQRWETDWSNVVERRQQGTHKVSDWNLRKRKTRHLAQERDISRGRASHLMKHEGVEVSDEVVL